MNKEECSEVLTRLLRPYFASVEIQNAYHSINKGHSIDYDSNVLTLLIEEHYNPQPYKFEELKKGMWVWDNAYKVFLKIIKIIEYGNVRTLKVGDSHCKWHIEFKENRFFPITKAMEYQE